MKLAHLLLALAVAAFLAAAACDDKDKSQGAGGAGGAGAGGRGGAGGTASMQCPPAPAGSPCEPFTCGTDEGCRCKGAGCCGSIYSCRNGKVESIEIVDYCPPNCDDYTGGSGGGTAGAGGTGP